MKLDAVTPKQVETALTISASSVDWLKRTSTQNLMSFEPIYDYQDAGKIEIFPIVLHKKQVCSLVYVARGEPTIEDRIRWEDKIYTITETKRDYTFKKGIWVAMAVAPSAP